MATPWSPEQSVQESVHAGGSAAESHDSGPDPYLVPTHPEFFQQWFTSPRLFRYNKADWEEASENGKLPELCNHVGTFDQPEPRHQLLRDNDRSSEARGAAGTVGTTGQ